MFMTIRKPVLTLLLFLFSIFNIHASLPQYVLIKIFKELDDIKELNPVACVNKQWHQAANTEEMKKFWMSHYHLERIQEHSEIIELFAMKVPAPWGSAHYSYFLNYFDISDKYSLFYSSFSRQQREKYRFPSDIRERLDQFIDYGGGFTTNSQALLRDSRSKIEAYTLLFNEANWRQRIILTWYEKELKNRHIDIKAALMHINRFKTLTQIPEWYGRDGRRILYKLKLPVWLAALKLSTELDRRGICDSGLCKGVPYQPWHYIEWKQQE